MAIHKTEFQKLNAELAQLDRERRVIIQRIKSIPEWAMAHIQDTFKAKANTWLIRDDGTGTPMKVVDENLDKIIRFTGITVTPNEVKPGTKRITRKIQKMRSTLYNVKLEVENINGAKYSLCIKISVDRPIGPQLFQSLHELTPLQVKRLNKHISNLNAERDKQEQIQKLQETIAKATAEIQKLQANKK